MTSTRSLLLAQRERAQQRAAALERELAGIAEAASEPGTDDEHDPEGATLAFERQHTAALLDQAQEQIAEIDAAIGRLDDGTYGTCARCGRPIGEARLAARPAAATCVRCARLPFPRSREFRQVTTAGRSPAWSRASTRATRRRTPGQSAPPDRQGTHRAQAGSVGIG